MTEKTKTGSSRRKGDEYQDLTALRLALEYYVEGKPFELFIEYENAGNLDDIVIQQPQRIDAYQVKYAIDPHATYGCDDFIDKEANVFFGRFAASWKRIVTSHPGLAVRVHLRTNRTLDSALAQLVDANGHFDAKFQQGRYRKDKAQFRRALKDATSLSPQEFPQFLERFHFDVGHPSWKDLENHIQAVLLDHKLGISDRQVFAELKRVVERHAIELHSPITFDQVDSILRESQSRFLLSQRFSVDEQRFVQPPNLGEQLDRMLATVDGDYIVVTGPPGSGKSTALTKYFNGLSRANQYYVVRYYCFVRIDDNQQRLRLEAQSLRVNLLHAIHRAFPGVLDRRYDVSGDNFLSSLQHLGTYCQSEGKKLVVFVDGLDHAERDDTVRDDVVQALPAHVPSGVVFVIGTQELRRWTPLALQEGRERRHIPMPFFSYHETEQYLRTGCQLTISDSAVQQVQEKSAGLPLYLRYIAELMLAAERHDDVVQALPATVEGDIRNYYAMLWNAFDAEGRGNAKYLSFVLALLRFRVHSAELYDFQRGITSRGAFDESYRQVRHLLRDQDGLIGIFHNSFRAFLLDRLPPDVRREIVTAILDRLKQEECSPRWYKHAFTYAAEATDHQFVLSHVNLEFVDQALLHNRNSDTIEETIRCAIDAAAAEGDIVQLSRLGSLRHRTSERLEYQFPWLTRAETLLHLGRVDDVVTEFYAETSEHLEVSHAFALRIILWLKELGKDSLAEKLFRNVLDDREGPESLGKGGTLDLARCAGIFPTSFARVMRWLAGATVDQDILEPKGFEPQYAPHLEAYLTGVVSHKPNHHWEWMKCLEQPFPSRLIRYYLIRALADVKPGSPVLAEEIADYIHHYPDDRNVELAFLATKAQMTAEVVQTLAGQFSMPKEVVSDHDHRPDLERHIKEFAYWAVVLGYTGGDAAVEPIRARLQGDKSVWAAAIGHLLHVGQLLGVRRRNGTADWIGMAIQSLERLKTATHVSYERTPDALDAVRFILPDSLLWVSQVLSEQCPERLPDWLAALLDLRSSFIWTTHYGINEYVQNYSFEFPIWRGLARLPSMRHNLKAILVNCAESYANATKLKGGSRGDHFLELSAIAAQCGFRDDAENWLREGVNGTLSYGYRKDTTLMNLADVLRHANKFKPEKALARSAAVLEMIKWMHNVTEGSMTQHFPQNFFPIVLNADRLAGLDLLRFYYERFGEWQADECAKTYILSSTSGDSEYLWALASLLHPNESVKCRQHIVRLPAVMSGDAGGNSSWSKRLTHYVLTSVNPVCWPEDMKPVIPQDSQEHTGGDEEGHIGNRESKPLNLDGGEITETAVIELCRQSIGAMVEVLDKLHAQNEHLSDYRILDAVLPLHIDQARTDDDLAKIEGLIETREVFTRASYFARLGSRYIQQGNLEHGRALLEKGFRDSVSTTTVESCIATLARFDRRAARQVCIDGIRESLEESYHGHDTPCVVAAACEVLDEREGVERVFDDYLAHCQALFRSLPTEHWFDWLAHYVPSETDERKQIVGILIDRLTEPAIESGLRLLAALCELCCERGSPVVEAVVARVVTTNGLQQARLLQVLQAVAYRQPETVRQHGQELSTLLVRGNASLTLLVRDILRRAFRDTEPPKEVAGSLNQCDRDYSSMISYRSFRIIQRDTSPEFGELLRRAALLDFQRQLHGCCEVLSIDVDRITGHLQRRFAEQGGLLETVREEIRYDWKGYVHPQGWPMRWIVPSFHVTITGLLYEVVDEVLRKTRVQPSAVEAIWRIIQPSDPRYLSGHPSLKPADVPSLVVADQDQWIAELETTGERTIFADFQGEWVTAFEHREMAQAGNYDIEYRSIIRTSAGLIRPEYLASIHTTDETFEHPIVTHHPCENLTWDQFREEIVAVTHIRPEDNSAVWPVASTKRSARVFAGFHSLATLCPYLIGDHSLEFSDFDLICTTGTVARFEVWREGWFGSDYCDEPMALGCRLRVRADFLKLLCSFYHRAFVSRTEERRQCYESYRKEPVKSHTQTRYMIVASGFREDDSKTVT